MSEISIPGRDGLSYQLISRSAEFHAGPGYINYLCGQILEWSRNGKKVALVFDRQEALDYWQLQIDQLAKQKAEDTSWQSIPDALELELSLYQKEMKVARAPLLGSVRASHLLGRQYLRTRQSRAALPAFSINTEGLEFSESEYLLLLEQIKNTGKLLKRLGQVNPALRQLNSGIFRYQSEAESEAFIREKLASFQERTAALYRAYSLSLDRYSQQRTGESNHAFRSAKESVSVLELWLKKQQSSLKGRSRDQFRKQLKSNWNQWKKEFNKADLFQFDLPEKPERESVESLLQLMATYTDQLSDWHRAQSRKVREDSVGLSPGSLKKNAPLKVQLQQLAKRLDQLIADINEAGLYHLPLSAEAATSLRQQKLLEQLQDQMQQTAYLLDTYAPNYQWQQNWFALHPAARRIVSPLMHLPEENWEDLFSSWYWGQCLNNSPTPHQASISQKKRAELAEQIQHWRFRSLPIRPILLSLATDQWDAAPLDYVLKIGEQLAIETSQAQQFQAGLLPQKESSYHVLAGPDLPASLGFLQAVQSRQLPKWRVRPPWPNTGKRAYSIGLAPVDYQGKWPGQLPHIYALPEGRIQLFIGRLNANSPGLEALAQLMTFDAELDLIHQLEDREITQFLLTDGFHLSFLVAAMLRATEAIEDEDRAGWAAMIEESRLRLGLQSPIEHALLVALTTALPPHTYRLNQAWRDSYLPMVVQRASTGQQTVILPDGLLAGEAGPAEECLRQADLIAAGFKIFDLRIANAREDWEACVAAVVKLSE